MAIQIALPARRRRELLALQARLVLEIDIGGSSDLHSDGRSPLQERLIVVRGGSSSRSAASHMEGGTMLRKVRLVVAAATGLPILSLGVWALPAHAATPSTPFALSSVAAASRQPSVAKTPVTNGLSHRQSTLASGGVSVGTNVDVIGSSDVTQQAVINGVSVKTCNPGKNTAQNETTIASNGSTLVGGANDYRLYEPSENRYDSSG